MTINLNERLSRYSDDDLIEEIGRLSIGTPIASKLVEAHVVESDIPIGLNALDDLRDLGTKVFSRVARELYTVICGNGEADENDRKTVLGAAGLSEAIVQAAIVSILTSIFGIGAALSAALALLIIRRVIMPAGDEVCHFWHDKYL